MITVAHCKTSRKSEQNIGGFGLSTYPEGQLYILFYSMLGVWEAATVSAYKELQGPCA